MLQSQRFVQLAAAELHRNDFAHPTHKAIWDAVMAADADPTADKTNWVHAVMNHAESPTVQAVVTELSVDLFMPRTGITQETAAKTYLTLAAEACSRRIDKIERLVANPDLAHDKMLALFTDLNKAVTRAETIRDRLHQIDGNNF